MRKMGVQGVITPKGEIKVPMRDRKRLDAELKKNNIKNYTMSSESFEIEEGAPGQNPLKTTFGGMKAAQNTPSYKRYQAKLKAEREARQREFERDQVAKKGTREEVEVDEHGRKPERCPQASSQEPEKRKKGEKLASKDHDGDGKIETGSQEFLGSRDRAIKAAIAARRGN